jgi:tryptophan-rich hypothetical protein
MDAVKSLQPKKLLLSKWTAVKPVAKQKHFLVTKVIQLEPDDPIELVEIEAIHSKKVSQINWRELRDETIWRRGWA